MSTVRKIKADAQVSITLGTSFIGSLQTALIWTMEQLTEEQREQLQQELQNNNYMFDEPVMNHAVTLLVLVRTIEKKVTDDGLFIEEPISPQEN
jgi:hypothetical protein